MKEICLLGTHLGSTQGGGKQGRVFQNGWIAGGPARWSRTGRGEQSRKGRGCLRVPPSWWSEHLWGGRPWKNNRSICTIAQPLSVSLVLSGEEQALNVLPRVEGHSNSEGMTAIFPDRFLSGSFSPQPHASLQDFRRNFNNLWLQAYVIIIKRIKYHLFNALKNLYSRKQTSSIKPVSEKNQIKANRGKGVWYG